MDEFDISEYLGGGMDTGGFDFNLGDIMAGLEGIGTDLGPTSSMGMDQGLLDLIGLGDLGDGDFSGGGFDTGGFDFDKAMGDLSGSGGTGGYYDELTGQFISDKYGQLQGPLDEKSGTNLDSMKGYTYDKATGTTTTPDGKAYTPAIVPSGQSKSGAQVMVDAGALPPGYAGVKPGVNSTAGGNADKYTYNVGPDGKSLLDKTSAIDKKAIDAGIKSGTVATPGGTVRPGGVTPGGKKGMDPSMMMMLMLLLSQMGKGGGGSSQASSIPQLSASRSQLPYTAPSRPGAGGQTYFSPTTYAPRMAGGGMAMAGGGGISSLGGYSDGGRLLKGPGDGVSDNIPATIAGKQPARLADGEFVVPARIVSELGNGSTDAGAKRLYEMMDRVQKARRKTKNVAADTKARKYLPA
jgi:hypothetical protein